MRTQSETDEGATYDGRAGVPNGALNPSRRVRRHLRLAAGQGTVGLDLNMSGPATMAGQGGRQRTYTNYNARLGQPMVDTYSVSMLLKLGETERFQIIL